MASGNAAPPTYTPEQAAADAQKQAGMNKEAAETQQKLNMVGQSTPFGSLTYEKDDSQPGGYRAVQSLSPENQNLFDQYMKLGGKYGTTGNALMDNVSSTLSKPWSFDAQGAAKISDMQKQFLDPDWNTRQDALENSLANRGITRGSQAWDTETQRFNTDRTRAYDNMYLDAYTKARDTSLQEYNNPLSTMNAFMTGTQPQGMNLTQTPQENVAAPDYMSQQLAANKSAMDAWKQEQANSNAQMGGLFGLGSSAITGTAFVM